MRCLSLPNFIRICVLNLTGLQPPAVLRLRFLVRSLFRGRQVWNTKFRMLQLFRCIGGGSFRTVASPIHVCVGTGRVIVTREVLAPFPGGRIGWCLCVRCVFCVCIRRKNRQNPNVHSAARKRHSEAIAIWGQGTSDAFRGNIYIADGAERGGTGLRASTLGG